MPRRSRCLRERDYVKLEKKRLYPEDKGRVVTAFLESFFTRYVGYDFTADLEEKLDLISNHEIDWKAGAARFLGGFFERDRCDQGSAHDAGSRLA